MSFFPEVPKLEYEGPTSTNPLSFRHYNADEVVAGKPMREHFRFAFAAAQVKKCLEVTKDLGGQNYVFWGGREGYTTLLNTDMKRELDHLAKFFHLAVDYKKKIGFTGQFLIEPKPKEPTTHQYDFDAAACLNFLRQYGLTDSFKLNIETNHATLAGHTVMPDLFE